MTFFEFIKISKNMNQINIKRISIKKYNAIAEECDKYKNLAKIRSDCIDALNDTIKHRNDQIKTYQNQIDIAIKNDVRQRFKITSINKLLYYFNTFINYEVCNKITSEFKDKVSDDQLNKIIKIINDVSHDKTVDIVGEECFDEKPDEKCYQIFDFINNDYKSIIQEKDDQINKLQKQLVELQHNNLKLSEEINKMLE